jgi:hypothetical protein
MRWIALVLAFGWLVTASAEAALHFDFDYRYDSYGFFDDPARREALEAAGRNVNRYIDDLDAIIPTESNGWASFFTLPDGTATIILKDLPVAVDTMQVFVAGRPLPGRLAQSIDTAPVGNGDPDWVATVAYRGELGAADDLATDFGPMGGTISFNNDPTDVPWHFDLSTDELNANEFDFVTVAMHELFHLMGIGISVSFADHANHLGEFIGAESVSVGSSTNPTLKLDESEAHWQSGTKSTWNGLFQEALMAPGIFPGRRTFPTRLDRAALRDVGWEEAFPGDANRDRLFDTADLLGVFQVGHYETGELAGWSDGDWNDNGVFESGDLIEALATGTYEQLTPMASSARAPNEAEAEPEDPQMTVTYERQTGQLHVEVHDSALTALQVLSSDRLFLADALELNGPFDVSRTDKLFVMNLEGFRDLDLGSVLPPDLRIDELLSDLRIEGAWKGGGVLQLSQWRLVPEPAGRLLLTLGLLGAARRRRH